MRKHTATVTFLLVVTLAAGMLSGCAAGPMEPTRENFEEVSDEIQAAGRTLTAKEIAEVQVNDDAKRRQLTRVFVEPVEDAGFDLDATLADFAKRLRDGEFTEDEATVALGMLSVYRGIVGDLARWKIIREETRDLVLSASR